jgi:hypothetical protein
MNTPWSSRDIAVAHARVLELQGRLCAPDLTMTEWELIMGAYRIAELQLRVTLGFATELPAWAMSGAGEAVH